MNHFNLKPIQNFDIEDRHAIVAYIEERPLEEFTVANIQSTLLTARNMSEAAIGISGLSGVAGIVASGMAFSFAGFTLPVLMPIAGAVASGLWAIKAFTDTNAQSAEYNLLRDPKIQQKLGTELSALVAFLTGYANYEAGFEKHEIGEASENFVLAISYFERALRAPEWAQDIINKGQALFILQAHVLQVNNTKKLFNISTKSFYWIRKVLRPTTIVVSHIGS